MSSSPDELTPQEATLRVDAGATADDATQTPAFVVTSEGDLLGENTAENIEIVRRIRACVNACEGLTTADLENGIITQMTRLVSDLTPLIATNGSRAFSKAS